ncbi:MAG TPA: ATP-binding protein [Terriglobales bacterium]|nr:ATP-binding protein [Terriglobales bacterium]
MISTVGSREGPRPAPTYGPLLDALPHAVLLVNNDGDIVEANDGALGLFGGDRSELVGGGVERLIPGLLRARDHAIESTAVPSVCRRTDGEEFSADVTLRAMETEDGVVFVTSVRESTDPRPMEGRLRALLDVSRAALEPTDAAAVLREVARRARELVGAELAVVATCDEGPATYRVRTADGAQAAAVLGASLGSWPAARAGGSVHPAPARLAKLVDAGPTVAVPLPDSTARPACLAIVRQRGGPRFSSADLALVELFAAQAAVAVNYISVREKLQRLAVVAERDRIGRELHDGTIQALFSVGISLQASETLTDDPLLLARLENGVTQIDAVIGDLRNYIFGLRPGGLSRRPLEEALYELADRFQVDHGVSATVDVDGGLAAELADIAADLLQLTREALANVAKHAHAHRCEITLRRSGEEALLQVEDDGAGFVPDAARDTGWGLRNIEERAAVLGGRVEIRTALGTGTTIRLFLPR